MTRAAGWWLRLHGPEYNLAATLDSGQAFRWKQMAGGWEGVVGRRWVRLEPREDGGVDARTAEDPGDGAWLREYLGWEDDVEAIHRAFPTGDACLREAVAACRGLHLLRQDPWECLASFILSSTKQIVQIRRIVEELCVRYGEEVRAPGACGMVKAFPSALRLARLGEPELRACGMGFRARYLGATARRVASGAIDLAELRRQPLAEARRRLIELPGVGPKIADCVLLFSCGFREAFPVDVWILRVVRELYFEGREVRPREVEAFIESHFGPEGGYAQQYLFHWRRLRAGRVASAGGIRAGSGRDGV